MKRNNIQQNCFPIGGMLGGNVVFILWGFCAQPRNGLRYISNNLLPLVVFHFFPFLKTKCSKKVQQVVISSYVVLLLIGMQRKIMGHIPKVEPLKHINKKIDGKVAQVIVVKLVKGLKKHNSWCIVARWVSWILSLNCMARMGGGRSGLLLSFATFG